MQTDKEFMELALNLAGSARGNTNPNPLVGAVLVKNGIIIGTGFHRKAGEPHAEVHAFNMAGEQAHGATLYVTLEPCSHFGKTPPCANLVKESGVRRVVVAMEDPNPSVAGRGIALLRDAGIEVEVGLLRDEAYRLNERFIHNMTTNRPFIVSKFAMTLDGKIATASGHSQWVTGEEARADVHELRNEMDGILVGVGTVLKDNPMLTTRLQDGRTGKNPTRIVLDSKLQTPLFSHVANTDIAPTILVTSMEASERKAQALEAQGVKIIRVSRLETGLELETVLRILYTEGITDILVEGGGEVNASFLSTGLIDKFFIYMSPKILGGAHSITPFGGRDVETMDEALPVDFTNMQLFGSDLRITAYPKKGEVRA